MNEIEIADLLTEITGYTGAEFGAVDVNRWLTASQRAEATHGVPWTLETAIAAVHDHFSASTDWLKPAHITQRLAEVQAAVRKGLTAVDYQAPRELRDDPAAEIRWLRAVRSEHVRRGVVAWALTGVIPDTVREAETLAVTVRQDAPRLALEAADA